MSQAISAADRRADSFGSIWCRKATKIKAARPLKSRNAEYCLLKTSRDLIGKLISFLLKRVALPHDNQRKVKGHTTASCTFKGKKNGDSESSE